MAVKVSNKLNNAFEGVFIDWWLMGPMVNKGTVLDFLGVHPEFVARGLHWYDLVATGFLMGLAFLGRWRQLSSL